MDPVKVLHIITNLPVGGAQDNTLATLERLDPNIYHLSLIAGPEGDWIERAECVPGLECIYIKEMVREIHLWKDFISFAKLYFLIKKGKYTIVHTHSSKPGFYGRLAAKLARVPLIIHTIHGFPFHDFMPRPMKWFYISLEKFLSGISDELITVSKLNLKQALDLKLEKPEKFTNIYSGIDFSRFDQHIDIQKKRQSLGIQPEQKIIGMVGRLTECKGIDTFFQAAQLLNAKLDNLRFLMVGDGELREDCERWAQEAGVTDKTLFLGFRDDIHELLQILDVYVLSSRWEGLGRALTEAMYSARPTVATRVAGVPEIVHDQKTGLLIPPNHPQKLAEAMFYLLDNPDIAKNLGQNAHQLIKSNFCVEKMVEDINQLYKKSLKNISVF